MDVSFMRGNVSFNEKRCLIRGNETPCRGMKGGFVYLNGSVIASAVLPHLGGGALAIREESCPSCS